MYVWGWGESPLNSGRVPVELMGWLILVYTSSTWQGGYCTGFWVFFTTFGNSSALPSTQTPIFDVPSSFSTVWSACNSLLGAGRGEVVKVAHN